MKFHLRKPIPWFQIMKITLNQILIAILLTGVAYSNSLKEQDMLDKKVNLTVQNISLVEVLADLQKNNSIKFIYSKSSINMLKKVSIDAVNQPLKYVLDQILKPNGIDYEVLKNRIVLGKSSDVGHSVSVDAEQADVKDKIETTEAVSGVPVSGKIVDTKGEPIIGVTVIEKGTTNGTTTDINGKFTLNVQGPNSILVISFIGYKKMELEVGHGVKNITLEEDV